MVASVHRKGFFYLLVYEEPSQTLETLRTMSLSIHSGTANSKTECWPISPILHGRATRAPVAADRVSAHMLSNVRKRFFVEISSNVSIVGLWPAAAQRRMSIASACLAQGPLVQNGCTLSSTRCIFTTVYTRLPGSNKKEKPTQPPDSDQNRGLISCTKRNTRFPNAVVR